MFVIETLDGEQQIVKTLDGYEDCTVLAENVRRPKPGQAWCCEGKQWKKAEHRPANGTRKDFEARLEEMEKRVVVLEAALKKEGSNG